METKDILSILAVLLSPVIAIQVDKLLERRRISHSKKVDIFKTLMATRGSVLSIEHVSALNRIDLEFLNNKKYKYVVNSWKEYFDNLKDDSHKMEETALKAWDQRNSDLLANLLYCMGTSLNYNFNIVDIKRNIYSPIGHINYERDFRNINSLMLKVLNGDMPIKITQDVDEESMKTHQSSIKLQMILQEQMIKYYTTMNNQNEQINNNYILLVKICSVVI